MSDLRPGAVVKLTFEGGWSDFLWDGANFIYTHGTHDVLSIDDRDESAYSPQVFSQRVSLARGLEWPR